MARQLTVIVAVLLCLGVGLSRHVQSEEVSVFGQKSNKRSSSRKYSPVKASKLDTNLGASFYNGYVLATSWPKTTCAMKTCNPNLNLPGNVFNLHGLWPTDLSTDQSPSDCASDRLNLRSLSADVQRLVATYWNSLYGSMEGFVNHEWTKHGTCMNFMQANLASVPGNLISVVQIGINAFNQANSIARQESYIRMSVALSQTYNIYNALASKGIIPGNKLYNVSDIQNAIRSYFGVSNINVYCGRTNDGTQNISEVRICLNNDFKVVSCPKDKSGCPNQAYYRN